MQPHKKKVKTEYQNRLPHIAPIGATFFVTFRLGDSLPKSTIDELRKELKTKVAILERNKGKGYKNEIRKEKERFFKKYDHQLDIRSFGSCYLKQAEIAKIICDKLHELDGDKYELIAYCIMPNHVHVLFDTAIQVVDEEGFFLKNIPENYFQLNQIMKLIKGSTAFAANRVLNRKGKFWQKDSFDRYIRDEEELWRTIYYIIENPVKAKLVEHWKEFSYTYLANRFSLSLMGE